MKIAIIGDIHSNTNFLKDLMDAEKDVDVFLAVGDLSLYGSIETFNFDKKAVKKCKIENAVLTNNLNLPKPLYTIKGNHDDYEYMYTDLFKSNNIIYLKQGEILNFGNINICGFGGIFSSVKTYMDSDALVGRQRRFFTLSEINKVIESSPKIDILITHQCAANILTAVQNKSGEFVFQKDEGSLELNKLLVNLAPKYYICGHHHKNFVTELNGTKVIGLGNFSKNKESYTIIDI